MTEFSGFAYKVPTSAFESCESLISVVKWIEITINFASICKHTSKHKTKIQWKYVVGWINLFGKNLNILRFPNFTNRGILFYTNGYFSSSYPSCFCKVWLWTNKEFQQMKSSWIPYKVQVIHPFVICSQPKSFFVLCCIQIQCWFQKRMLPLQYLFHKQGNLLRGIVKCKVGD